MTTPDRYDHVAGLRVHRALRAFVEQEVLPGAKILPAPFWEGLAAIIRDLAGKHRELLAVRDEMQAKIDAWHRERKGEPHDAAAYEGFLREIDYLRVAPAADAYKVATKNVDAEIGSVAGPQLVVPVSNARYALNAANARWGSLYDALYGSDASPQADGAERSDRYNPVRGAEGGRARAAFLDQAAALDAASHTDVASYAIERGRLEVVLANGGKCGLKDPSSFAGYRGPRHAPTSILLVNNGLHIEIVVDRDSEIGKADAAGVSDVVVEAAISTIMDLEDAVAAVDAEDKIVAYRNWLGLMSGALAANVEKGGTSFERRLNEDRSFTTPSGATLTLHGRSLMLVRNVGHHMFTDAVLDEHGEEVPEAILDAAITVAGALQDIRGENRLRNSRTGSVYVVKPKMHGSDEVGLADALFRRIEELFGLPRYTMKIGVMDEERRTSLNLAACLSRVRDRTVFINTGFLDRTGDEIHTSMEAGPMVRKGEMKSAPWIKAYEANNVDVGIARNLPGRAQIGKGMWAAPDRMAELLAEKIVHPRAGATTAWVPTPHRRDPARPALPRRRRRGGPGRPARTPPRYARGSPHHSAGDAHLLGCGNTGRARQQPAGPLGLCGALGRPGRRLLDRAGHPRRPSDGGPGHAAHFQPARRQLAAPRPRHRGAGARHAAADGGGGRPPEPGHCELSPYGTGLRRACLQGGRGLGVQGPRPAQRLHGGDPSRPSAGGQGAATLTRRGPLARGPFLLGSVDATVAGREDLVERRMPQRPHRVFGDDPVELLLRPSVEGAVVDAGDDAILHRESAIDHDDVRTLCAVALSSSVWIGSITCPMNGSSRSTTIRSALAPGRSRPRSGRPSASAPPRVAAS